MHKCYLSTKKTLTLLIVVLFSNSTIAQLIDDIPRLKDKNSFSLLGAVKEVEELEYLIEVTISSDTLVKNDTTYNLIAGETLVFDSLENLKIHTTSSYNNKSKIKASYIHLYSYKNSGEVSTIRYYKDNNLQYTKKLVYDNKKRITELKKLGKKGRLESNTLYYYKEGKIFNIKIKNEESVMKNFIRLVYNSKGQLRKREYRGETMQLLNHQIYVYDTLNDGNTRLNLYNYATNGKLNDLFTYQYDQNGNTIQKTITDSNKRTTFYQTCTYNNKNELIKLTDFSNEVKEETIYQYDYDQHNNWTKQILFLNGELNSIKKRTINYRTIEEK